MKHTYEKNIMYDKIYFQNIYDGWNGILNILFSI